MTEDFQSIWDHSYELLDGQVKVLVHEDLDAGLGGTLFDGSVALSAYMEFLVRHVSREHFAGATVLELGAGCGFPGLFAGKLGCKQVLLTDCGQHVELLQENIDLNQLTHSCEAHSLDWTSASDLQTIAALGLEFDYILCADVVYSEQFVDPLLHVLRTLCTPNKTQVLFSHPKARMVGASALFWERLPEHFTLEKVPAQQFVLGWTAGNKQFANSKEGVFIIRIKT